MQAVKACPDCTRFSPIKKPAVIQPIIAAAPFQRLVIDLVTLKDYHTDNKGYKYILTVIDAFTQYVWAFPQKSKKATEVSCHLLNLFNTWKPCLELQSDNGKEFTADVIKALCHLGHVKIIHGAPYKPSTQGRIERFNQTLQRELAKAVNQSVKKTWIDKVDAITHSYNRTFHASIKMSPFTAMTGLHAEPTQYLQMKHISKPQTHI